MATSDTAKSVDQPSATSRVIALLAGSAYLGFLAVGVMALYEIPILVAAAAVIAGAAIIIGVIAIFCVKLVERRDRVRQLKLSTLFLPFIPVAIYLPVFSQITHRIKSAPGVTIGMPSLLGLLAFYSVFALVTTALLLRFGEAVIWLAMCLHKWRQSAR